jgi:hypothetical protein
LAEDNLSANCGKVPPVRRKARTFDLPTSGGCGAPGQKCPRAAPQAKALLFELDF